MNRRSTLLAQVIASNALAITALIFVGVVALDIDQAFEGQRAALIVLMMAIVFSLSLNIFILRRQFAPLDKLMDTMDKIDLTQPGERAELDPGATEDISELIVTFNDMIERLEEERRKNTEAALTAQENERARVARDLHDEVNQALTAVMLRLEAASDRVPKELAAELAETKRLAGQAMEELLELARRLRPTALDLGLRNALEAQVRDFGTRTGIDAKFECTGDKTRLTAEQELVIYRVAQEAMTNVVQHSGAAHMLVRLHTNAATRLEVSDDGHGFELDEPSNRFGIAGMRERALLVGGRLTIKSVPESGTTVRLEVK